VIWRAPAGAGQVVTGSVVFGPVVQVRDVSGAVTVVADRPPYRIDQVRPGAVPLAATTARDQPSRLLLARHQVVPFAGRDAELAALNAWLGGGATMSVRLIHAAGGQGKTRLARHVAARGHAAGWVTWRVLHAPGQPGSGLDVPAGGGALVVVDYADRWPTEDLGTLVTDLNAVSLRTGMVLRVLLLARSAGFWWAALRDRLDSDHGITADAAALLPLDEHTDRAVLFGAARERFADALNVPGAGDLVVPGLSGDGFRQILAVHMAALVAVDAHHRGRTPPTQPHALSAYLLNREKAHWHQLHVRGGDRRRTSPEAMGRAVYLATLTGPVTRDDAETILTRTKVTEPGVATIIDDHRFCYPTAEPAKVLQALRPDRLGEDLIALSTPGHPYAGADDWEPDDWAATAAHALLAGEPGDWTPAAVTVLVETARRWPHVATGVLYPLLRHHPGLALAAGGATITRLAELPGVDTAALHAIEALLPHDRHLTFDTAAAAISTVLTRHRLATATTPAGRAQLLAAHALRLAHAGRPEEALVPAGEAVAIGRRLAAANPAYRPDLAGALHNLGASLSRLGRREEALVPAGEALTIYRELVAANPAAYLPDMAMSLHNLGMFLSGLGRGEEALAPAGEAVVIHRRLVEVDPAAHQPDLATSLNNLGASLSRLGRREEALVLIEEATGIYRRLAEVDPAAHLPDLATSLNNLGASFAKLGRREEALVPAEEAVALGRRLAEVNPAAYLPSLATSLNNLGTFLSRLGRLEEALGPAEESVGIYRRLAGADPVAHLPDLAGSLNNLGSRLSDQGRREEALVPTEEAVAIGRRLAAANPAAYLSSLATSLNNLGASFAGLGRREEAIGPAEEAAGIHRRLAEVNPAAHLPDLAGSLNNVGTFLNGLGRREEALVQVEEAVTINRRLAEVNPAAHLPDLAGSLNNLGMLLSGLGRREEALVPVEEAVTIYRRLAAPNAVAHLPSLATSLNNLGNRLSELGRRAEALGRAGEAVTIRRRLAAENPAAYRPDLAGALRAYAWVCVNVKDNFPEALNAVTEAIGIYEPLAGRLPQKFAAELFGAYQTFADVLEGLGRTDQADDLRRQLDEALGDTPE